MSIQDKARTFANVLGDSRCECADRGCPIHTRNVCVNGGNTILYCVDMEDNNGTVFCDDCANDASMSGLFVEWDDPAFDEEDESEPCPC